MEIASLIELIETAFNGVEFSSTSMRQFQLTDKFGMSREITAKEWYLAGKNRVDNSWQEIPDSEIEECDVLLSHMIDGEYIYFLPAYMIYSLKHYTSSALASDSFILGSTIYSLSAASKQIDLRDYQISKFKLINETQKAAIVEFLRFIAMSQESIYGNDALAALNSYWESSEELKRWQLAAEAV